MNGRLWMAAVLVSSCVEVGTAPDLPLDDRALMKTTYAATVEDMPREPRCVLDFDSDGVDDLMHLNDLILGGASFPPKTHPGMTWGGPNSCERAGSDYNGDGYDDLVVGNGPAVHYGTATAVATSGTALPVSTEFLGDRGNSADFDGDGYDDLWYTTMAMPYPSLYRGGPSGLSTTPFITLSTPQPAWDMEVWTGDFDDDGDVDVFVEAGGLFLVSSSGTTKRYHGMVFNKSGSSWVGTPVLPYNYDGNFHVFVFRGAQPKGGDALVVVDQLGFRSSSHETRLCTPLTSCTVHSSTKLFDHVENVDVDGDGDFEYVTFLQNESTYDYETKLWEGFPSGAVTTLHPMAEMYPWNVGDFDGDGYDEIVGFDRVYTLNGKYMDFTIGEEYVDGDGDGYEYDDDCDDSDGSVHPGAVETVDDGIDQDCDGNETCLTDADLDGFPTDEEVLSSDFTCTAPGVAGLSASLDCDDSDDSVHPDAIELPGDAFDQDCDGLETCFVDADQDRFRTSETVSSEDIGCAADGLALESAGPDCNDADEAIYPGAEERAGDGVDQDCDGLELCFRDADGDGWRTEAQESTSIIGCDSEGLVGVEAPTGDCDDEDSGIFPGAEDLPDDGIDQDCSGADAEGRTCSSAGAVPTGFVGLIGLLVVGFRRRSAAAPLRVQVPGSGL